jgi:GrpB-like predicted nucleotidyltransferase (UPF0157 family)
MIDEPIHLEKHDLLWQQYFIQERERIRQILHDDSTAIQHIGSTAISSIYAKPIVDIMIGVETFPPSQHLADGLVSLGYNALGEAGVPERLYFRYRGLRLFNVHVVEREGQHWVSNLALRDYLRAYPEEAKRYEEVKMKAVQSGVSSLLKYSEGKSVIVEELLSRALAWRAAI